MIHPQRKRPIKWIKRKCKKWGMRILVVVIVAINLLAGVIVFSKPPVRASSAKETPVIIKLCEPIDAVEVCKYIECRAEYEIEGFIVETKPRRD